MDNQTRSVRRMDLAEVREHLDGLRRWNVPISVRRNDIRAELRSLTDGLDADGDNDAIEPDDDGDENMIIEGYAAVFDSNSEPIMGMFTERIQRGAFKNVLATNPDVRLLQNHEGLALARTTNGTLALNEQPRGLFYRANLPDVQQAEDLYQLVAGGYVDQNSFAFRVAKGGDIWSCQCGDPLGYECDCTADQVVRTITNISDLYEVSVVTFPAYRATTVTAARSSEPGGEQAAQASDEEQRKQAPPVEASPQRSTSGIATHIRAFVSAHQSKGANYYESGTSRGAGPR